MADKPKKPKKDLATCTQVYVTVLDRGDGRCRVSQVYVAALTKDPSANGKARVSQVYSTVLARTPSWVRTTQVYVSVLASNFVTVSCSNSLGFSSAVQYHPKKEHISMGAVADLLAAPKSFTVPSNLSRYLENKTNGIDPDTPAAYGAKDEVQSIAIYEGTVSGGDFTLTVTLRDGTTFTTAAIAFDANAATIEGAIDTAATGVVAGWTNGDITVAGGTLDSAPVTLTFDGDSVAGQNHALSTIDGTGLTGGGSAGTITATTEGQTARPARAVLYNLGVIADATPPAQGLTTAPTKGANLLGVPPWVVRELAQEVAFEDLDNDIYQVLVVALLGYTDVAPLVAD